MSLRNKILNKQLFFNLFFPLFSILILVGIFVTQKRLVYNKDAGAENLNPVILENQKDGSDSFWILPGKSSSDAQGQIKGYASRVSINKGGAIALKVSVNPAQNYTMRVFRIGWYGGKRARLMQTIGPLPGTKQPDCPLERGTGMVECLWSTSYNLQIPTDWTSGAYLVQLTNDAGYQNYINFVVRDDERRAELLYNASVATWQAYNNYPTDGVKGKSLYDSGSVGQPTSINSTRAYKLSFDRPYADNGTELYRFEIYLIGWLEKMGYDVAYSTDVDMDFRGPKLLNYKGIIMGGHGEYYSKQMRDNLEFARDAGKSIAFLGGNPAYWQIRYEDTPNGNNRRIINYKDFKDKKTKDYKINDPIKKKDKKTGKDLPASTTTILFRELDPPRPEQALVGLQYLRVIKPHVDYVVTNANHWVYNGTGLRNGDKISKIVGHDTDTIVDKTALPENIEYTILSASPISSSEKANSAIYKAPSNAWVFSAGSNVWTWALGKEGLEDSRAQRITANVLNKFIGHEQAVPPPPTPTPTPLPPPPTPTPTPIPAPVINTPTPTTVQQATPTPTPTAPTPTPLPDDAIVSFKNIKLHGIGRGGDSKNPNSVSSKTPVNRQRNLIVEVYSLTNQLIKTYTGRITYSETSGDFSGTINLGSGLASDNYILKIKTDRYLRESIPGVVKIERGKTSQMPLLTLTAGDINNDNGLDILDYNVFKTCYAAKSDECKKQVDLNDDGVIDDGIDINLFFREISVKKGD